MYTLTIQCEDKEELIDYAKVSNYICFIEDFGVTLRTYYKYGLPDTITTPAETVELIREEFYKGLSAHDISR